MSGGKAEICGGRAELILEALLRNFLMLSLYVLAHVLCSLSIFPVWFHRFYLNSLKGNSVSSIESNFV